MASRETTPQPLQGPTAKEKKYDRQLRLWGANGQKALEETNILLFNSGPGVVGIEALKNLILPGIGKYTIVDEAIVNESDLGLNFFLSEESLGKSRAEECCRYLQELNPDVIGTASQQSIHTIAIEEHFVEHFTVILLVSPVKPLGSVSMIAQLAREWNISLFYIHSVGFYSHFSVQISPCEFPVIDTHPDPASTQDLRLLKPWKELEDFVRTKTENLENLNDHDHGHIPYLVLLVHYLDIWKASHDEAPQTYSEKTEFRKLIQDGARKANAEGGEENYDEAAAAVLKCLNKPQIPPNLQEVFDSEKCKYPKLAVSNFWFIAYGIRQFYNRHRVLPLPGSLPDMKAQSDDYIQLQNIYKARARKDLLEVLEAASIPRGELKADSALKDKYHAFSEDWLHENDDATIEKAWKNLTPMDQKEIEEFCKGATFIKLINGQLLDLPDHPGPTTFDARKSEYMYNELQNEESLLPIYLSFYVYDVATAYPGSPQEGEDAQATLLRNMIEYTDTIFEAIRRWMHWTTFLRTVRVPYNVMIPFMVRRRRAWAKYVKETPSPFDPKASKERIQIIHAELSRCSGTELHNISALTGGMVAQEVIKVITKQYIPMDNSCVFDGIHNKTGVFRIPEKEKPRGTF